MYDDTALVELKNSDFANNQFIFYINENGSLNQIYNSAGGSGRPGTGEFASDFRFPTTTLHDHTRFLESDKFLGLLTIARGLPSDVVLYYQRLKPVIERAIALVELQIS